MTDIQVVNHRLKWGTRILDIEEVKRPGRREAMSVVKCREAAT